MMDRSIQFLYSALSLVILLAAVFSCRDAGQSPVAQSFRPVRTETDSRYPIGKFAEPQAVSLAAFELPMPPTSAPAVGDDNAPLAAETVVFRPRARRLPKVQPHDDDQASPHEREQPSAATNDELKIEVGAPIHNIVRLPELEEENPQDQAKPASEIDDEEVAFEPYDVEATADAGVDQVGTLAAPLEVVEMAPHAEATDEVIDDSFAANTELNEGARWTSEKVQSLWTQQDSQSVAPPLASDVNAETKGDEPKVDAVQRLPRVLEEEPAAPPPQPTFVEPLPAPQVEIPLFEPVSETNAPPQAPTNQIPRAVDPMRAVNDRAAATIRHAFSLAQRGASFSAQTELTEALRMTAEALDMREGSRRHSDALKNGFKALEEASDFKQRGLAADLDMMVLVAGHQTPALKGQDLSGVTPLVGLQQYLTYAQEQLAIAGGEQPTSSVALFGLGRLQASLESDENDATPSAIVFHQAAVKVDPMNYKSANELGVLLARYGQYGQAYEMLAHSVRVCPQPASWRNLAQVHQQLGEHDLARKAAHEAQLASRNPTHRAAANSVVRWVQPAALAGTIGSHESNQPSISGPPTHHPVPRSQPESRNVGRQESEGLMRLIPWIRRGE